MSAAELTYRQKTLLVFPDARLVRNYKGAGVYLYSVVSLKEGTMTGEFKKLNDAWADASYLAAERTKCLPSPSL